jgi:transposase
VDTKVEKDFNIIHFNRGDQMSRKYTLEFKQEAVKLVTERGYSQAKAAKSLGISETNLQRWVQESQQVMPTKKEKLTLEQEEIKRLKKENERLKMEKEILKKAAAFFASELR